MAAQAKKTGNVIQGTRQDTWLVNLHVEHTRSDMRGKFIDYGVWDTKTGGEIDSEERLYYPGGMKPPYSLGGRITPGQITLSRNYRLGRDHDNIQQLINAVGVSRVKITITPMNRYKQIFMEKSPIVYTGTLKTLNLPEHNSESTSDPAMIEVVCTIDKAPTGPNQPGFA